MDFRRMNQYILKSGNLAKWILEEWISTPQKGEKKDLKMYYFLGWEENMWNIYSYFFVYLPFLG